MRKLSDGALYRRHYWLAREAAEFWLREGHQRSNVVERLRERERACAEERLQSVAYRDVANQVEQGVIG